MPESSAVPPSSWDAGGRRDADGEWDAGGRRDAEQATAVSPSSWDAGGRRDAEQARRLQCCLLLGMLAVGEMRTASGC